MYARQMIASAIAGAILGYAALSTGFSFVGAVAIGVLSFLGLRWALATVGRARYWLERGTRGIYYEQCENCNRRRYRVSGDWILQCHKCGWKPGWPVLRWLTRSVPVIQLRRSISRNGAIVALVGGIVLLLDLPRLTVGSNPVPTVSNLPSVQEILLALGMVILATGFLLWMLFFQTVYCRNCGQYLGRGKAPEKCSRCGSNRFSNQDPGVGKKVRFENIEDK